MNKPNPFLENKKVNPFLQDYEENTPIKKEEITQNPSEVKNEPSFLADVIERNPQFKLMRAGGILGGDILSAIKNGLLSTVSGGPEAVKQPFKEPERFLKNLGGGFLDLSKKFLNIPHDLPSFMEHIKLTSPEQSRTLQKYSPFPQFELKEDVKQFYGEPKSEADKLIRGIVENADILAPTGYAAIKGVKNIKKAFPNLEPIEKGLESATQTHLEQQEINKATQAASQIETGQANPNLMQNKINRHKKEINELNEKIEKDLPPEPGIDLLETPTESNRRFINSQHHAERADQAVTNIDNDLAQNLEHGADHHVEGARLLRNDLENQREAGTELYNDFEEHIAGQRIDIRNPEPERALMQRLREIVQEGRMDTPEYHNVLNQLDRLQVADNIPASQYVSAYKAVNGYMRNAYERAYQVGINEDVRNQWLGRAREAQEELNRMDQTLQQNIGTDNYRRFREASDYWRTNIIPLYQEPLYWKIMDASKSKLPKDLSESLAGSVPGGGLEIINNLARNNPQILKHIVGERYEANASNILNPNRRMRSYLDLMPETQQLINTRNQAQNIANTARERAELHKTFSEESKKLHKTLEGKIGKRSEWTKQRIDLENSIDLLEKHIPELRKTATNEKLALKEKLQAKSLLKKAEIQRSKARKKLLILGGLLSAPTIGAGAYHGLTKAGSLFTGE